MRCLLNFPMYLRVSNPSSVGPSASMIWKCWAFCIYDMKQKHPFLVIPLTFYHSSHKLLDGATSIGSQGCPIIVEFIKGIMIGIKHCWAQFPESRDWHNICGCACINFGFGLNCWTYYLTFCAFWWYIYYCKGLWLCLCWMLIAAVCNLAS